ncbi:phage baseplate assembly protein V [Roseateles sp. DXS20W]|uniref:Phage baseplate assembly protein V n=1 Tax=Pelomonas lactea TaxID=3299030 RepID=A0ABW7GJY0_9BURK
MPGLQRMLRPLAQRVQLMIGRAVLQLVDDGTKMQSLQVALLADELRGDVERFQNYGFTSHPMPGAEGVAVSVAGSRDHVIVVAVDDRRYRLTGLAEGEVAIYTDEGDHIVIKRGGTIEVLAATKVDVRTPLVECSGDLVVRGTLTVDGAAELNATLHVDGDISSDANIAAQGNVADQGGAKTMAGMRTTYNGHKHGTSATPTPGM